MSNIKDLLIVTDEDVAKVRKLYEKTEIEIQQDVAILKEWLRQQPHLPDDEDEKRLESVFFRNKCRLEQTKKKLDKYYSSKVLYPEMLDLYDINSARMLIARKSMMVVPLSKLTDKQERIVFFKLINADTFNGLDCFLYILLIFELCNIYDYSSATIFVVDWNGFTLNAIKSFEPNNVHVFSVMLMDALSVRYSSIHYINTNPYVNIFMSLAKAFMKPKLFGKITCPSSIEDVYNIVPKQILPIEYGGDGKSIYKLQEEWSKELDYHADLLMQISKRTSNETLRIEKLKENDLFGVEGSFKKINLD